MEKISARRAAVISLLRIEKDGRYSNIELDSAIKKYSLEGAEKGLYSRIVYGVLERMYTLDALIASVSARKLDTLDKEVLTVLRVGTYQLHFLDKVPQSAAVNESVKLVSRFGKGVMGYVNGVLRSVAGLDLKGFFEDLGKAVSKAELLSVKYSVLKETVELIIKQYGDKTEDILCALNGADKGMSLRVNTLMTSPEVLARKMGCELSSLCDSCIVSARGFAVEGEEHFTGGEYFVQSEPSALAARALGAKRGHTVIDACACPGGKTFSIAMDMENEGKIIACDLHENKLSLIKKGAERLGISIIDTVAMDGRNEKSELIECADRVLCDVPCSCLGTISKKPEIRYKSPEEYERLPEIQLAILQNTSRYLKHGGILVYSTCTFDKNENEGVVRRFIESDPDFECVDTEYSESFDVYRDGFGTCFLPSSACPDGFYVAKLVRK